MLQGSPVVSSKTAPPIPPSRFPPAHPARGPRRSGSTRRARSSGRSVKAVAFWRHLLVGPRSDAHHYRSALCALVSGGDEGANLLSYTFSTHSDSLTPWFLCKLTRPLRQERGPPMRRSLYAFWSSMNKALSGFIPLYAAVVCILLLSHSMASAGAITIGQITPAGLAPQGIRGITFDGEANPLVLDGSGRTIWRLDLQDASVISTFPLTFVGDASGLAFDVVTG